MTIDDRSLHQQLVERVVVNGIEAYTLMVAVVGNLMDFFVVV